MIDCELIETTASDSLYIVDSRGWGYNVTARYKSGLGLKDLMDFALGNMHDWMERHISIDELELLNGYAEVANISDGVLRTEGLPEAGYKAYRYLTGRWTYKHAAELKEVEGLVDTDENSYAPGSLPCGCAR